MPFLCGCCHASHFILFAFIHFREGTLRLRESGQNKKKRRKLNSDNLRIGNEGATSAGVMPTTVTPTSSFEQKGALQQVGSVDEFTASSSFEEKGSQSDRKFIGLFPIYLSHRMLSNHLCCFAIFIIKDFSAEDLLEIEQEDARQQQQQEQQQQQQQQQEMHDSLEEELQQEEDDDVNQAASNE